MAKLGLGIPEYKRFVWLCTFVYFTLNVLDLSELLTGVVDGHFCISIQNTLSYFEQFVLTAYSPCFLILAEEC